MCDIYHLSSIGVTLFAAPILEAQYHRIASGETLQELLHFFFGVAQTKIKLCGYLLTIIYNLQKKMKRFLAILFFSCVIIFQS